MKSSIKDLLLANPTAPFAHVADLCGVSRQRVQQVASRLGIKRNAPAGRSLGSRIEYKCWKNMIDRCHNQACRTYRYYGARGISVCERWRYSFRAFLEDVGARPSPEHSIDRINNDGNYEPTNCRWATRAQQMNNKRNQGLHASTLEKMAVAKAAYEAGSSMRESAKIAGMKSMRHVQRALADVVNRPVGRPRIEPPVEEISLAKSVWFDLRYATNADAVKAGPKRKTKHGYKPWPMSRYYSLFKASGRGR